MACASELGRRVPEFDAPQDFPKMKTIVIGALALSLAAASAASAQPRPYAEAWQNNGAHSDNGDRHDNGLHRGWSKDRGENHRWARGQRMGYNDWRSARQIDYREHHLRAPPRGYEWRESNGQYVLGAVATGLIVSAIINSGR